MKRKESAQQCGIFNLQNPQIMKHSFFTRTQRNYRQFKFKKKPKVRSTHHKMKIRVITEAKQTKAVKQKKNMEKSE